jgi:hypothetical protein
MTDTPPERRPTGEQPAVCIKTNNGPTWKWMAGALIAMFMSAGGVFVKASVDTARLEERIKAHTDAANNRNTLQDGLNVKFDGAFKDVRAEFKSMRDLWHRVDRRIVKIEAHTVPKRDRVPTPP